MPKRDLRDPQAIGKVLRSLVKHRKVPVLVAADELSAYAIADYSSNESCIDKYGKPGDKPPRFEEIQTR